jgi:6-phosphogluconolactonase/glucosamine-6-phosphate isomerase/deaminase
MIPESPSVEVIPVYPSEITYVDEYPIPFSSSSANNTQVLQNILVILNIFEARAMKPKHQDVYLFINGPASRI